MKLADDVVAGYLVGSGGKGHHRNVGKTVAQFAQLRLLGTEVVAPLADAMSLVYGKQ